MIISVKTVIFDLDGTIYQNKVFHRDYIHFLVEGTDKTSWESALIDFIEDTFSGKRLVMNQFYYTTQIDTTSPDEFFSALEDQICLPFTYEETLTQTNILYLGDAWAVVTLIGATLGLIADGRGDVLYHRIRTQMEQDGMQGDQYLKDAIIDLSKRCNVLLMSNSYEATIKEFLRQLDYENVFPRICSSSNKPFAMIDNLKKIDSTIFEHPDAILSIGDHAYNDLMPIAQVGGQTVWMNPFTNITRPNCDLELESLDELTAYLKTL